VTFARAGHDGPDTAIRRSWVTYGSVDGAGAQKSWNWQFYRGRWVTEPGNADGGPAGSTVRGRSAILAATASLRQPNALSSGALSLSAKSLLAKKAVAPQHGPIGRGFWLPLLRRRLARQPRRLAKSGQRSARAVVFGRARTGDRQGRGSPPHKRGMVERNSTARGARCAWAAPQRLSAPAQRPQRGRVRPGPAARGPPSASSAAKHASWAPGCSTPPI